MWPGRRRGAEDGRSDAAAAAAAAAATSALAVAMAAVGVGVERGVAGAGAAGWRGSGLAGGGAEVVRLFKERQVQARPAQQLGAELCVPHHEVVDVDLDDVLRGDGEARGVGRHGGWPGSGGRGVEWGGGQALS